MLLDCDSGRINYFIDGVKYGEHIINDLGCAFENISPFGFDADGCGSGGAAEVAASTFQCMLPKELHCSCLRSLCVGCVCRFVLDWLRAAARAAAAR